MPEFYEQLPQDVVRTGYELYENFTENITRDKKGHAKITNLFLVTTDNGLEFIQKHCLKAFWLRFVKCIKQVFGIDDQTFNIEKHLQVASKIIAGATAADDKYFDAIAQELSKSGTKVDGKKLRMDIYELGLHLRSIKSHVTKSKELKKKSVKVLKATDITLYHHEKTQEVAKKYLFQDLAEFREKTSSLLKDTLSPEEIEEVVSALSSQVDYGKAFQGLEQAALRKQLKAPPKAEDFDGLRLVLMKSLATLSAPRAEIIKKVLRKIEPEVPEEEPDPLLLEKFAKVFGDAFIAESGFEGDWSSRPYADLMMQFIDETKRPLAEGAHELRSVLENHVDLRKPEYTEMKLDDVIRQSLESSGSTPKRCILLGGWQVHAIVYEIVQQENGKYSFRVYNEGAGSEQHEQLEDRYKDKFQGAIAIKDIPKRLLFQTSFLNCLSSFCTMPKEGLLETKPEVFLINHILPMLDGSKEKIAPEVLRFLSPQRSGTCTYRSLLAFVANFMPQKDYKLFKFDFKLFLLEKYFPKLRHAATNPITSINAYDLARRQYNVLSRSIEKYANGIKKLAFLVPDADLERSERLLVQYKVELEEFQQQIFAFEKSIYGTKLPTLEGKPLEHKPVPAQSFDDVLQQSSLHNFPLFDNHLKLLQQLRSGPLEECLAELVRMQPNLLRKDFNYAVDLLFRRLGTIHAFDGITYSRPKEACQHFVSLISQLSCDICSYAHEERAELRGLFLFACYGLECAFKRLPPDTHVLAPEHLALLTYNGHIGQLRTSDPFITSILSEIEQFVSARKNTPTCAFQSIKLDDKADTLVSLSEELTNGISTWWFREENRPLREVVDASVKQDREEQKAEIERRTKEEKDELDDLKRKLATLMSQPPLDKAEKDEWRIKVAIVKGTIEHTHATIAQIPTKVQNDPRYWPPGFETPAHLGGFADHHRAAFLFAQSPKFFQGKLGRDDLFPPEFRAFSQVAILSANIFEKWYHTKVDHLQEISSRFIWSPKERVVKRQGFQEYYQTHPPFEHDIYLPSIRDPHLRSLYIEQFKQRTAEWVQAKTYAEFEKKAETERLQGDLFAAVQAPLDSDDFKEIYSLRSSDLIQVESVLSYFHEHLDKLQHSDWLNFFHSALFESDLVKCAMQDPKRRDFLLPRIQHFFQDAIKNATILDDFSQAANLVWIASNFQRYAPSVQVLEADVLLRLVQKASEQKYATQWPIVFEAILASSVDLLERQPVTEEEKKLFGVALLAHIKHTENPAPMENRCLPRLEAAEHAHMRLKERLSEKEGISDLEMAGLIKSHTLGFLKIMYPPLKDVTYEVSGRREFAGSDGSKISLIAGVLTPADRTTLLAFAQNVRQETLQILILKGLYGKDEDLAHLRCHRQEGITYIKDTKKNITLAFQDATSEIYVKKESEPWSYFVPIDKRSCGDNHELCRKYHHLQVGKTITLCELETFAPVYKNEDGTLRAVIDNLQVISPPQNNPFAAFEAPNCTSYLANDEGKIERIEFSRLKASFSKENDRFVLAQDKTWHIAEEQFVPHFGNTTGFLILENQQGEKKVLVPVWNPKKPKEGEKQALHFPFSYDFDEQQSDLGHYVECDLVGTEVRPKTLEARYYLAKIYLEKGRVDEAEELLASVLAESTSRALSKQERAALESIITPQVSQDTGSRTIRVKLQALYLLAKNDEHFPREEGEKAKIDPGLVGEYLNRLGHLPPLPVSHERYILQGVIKQISDLLEQARKNTPPTPDEKKAHHNYLEALETALRRLSIRLAELNGQEPLIVEKECRTEKISLPHRKFPAGVVWGEHLDYKPTSEDKIAYRAARKNNTFPFNVFNVSNEEMTKYYNLLRKEVECTYLFSTANKNGLMSGLYHMSFFAKDNHVSMSAHELLTRLTKNELFLDKFISWIWPNIPRHKFKKHKGEHVRQAFPSLPKTLPKGDLGLFCLQPIKATEVHASFLPNQANLYLTKAKVARGSIDATHIFDPNCPQAKDEVTKAQYEKTANDVLAAQNQATDDTYSLAQDKSLDELLLTVRGAHEKEAKLLAFQEQVILGSVHSALTSDPLSNLEFLSKKRAFPSIQELCVMAAKNDYYTRAKRLYPELTTDALISLKEAVKAYLTQKQYVQRLSRAASQTQELLATQGDSSTYAALMNHLGRTLEAKQEFALDDPFAMVFLVIETTLGITLRKDQVDNIKKYANSVGKDKEIALQMIMGAGKTHVLQPLLAFLLATPDSLSSVMVPEALLEPVRLGLSNAVGSAFSQSIYTLPYDRDLSHNLPYLDSFYQRLNEIQERSGVLLITPRQKHSIITSLYQAYFDLRRKDSEENRNRVEKISKICEVLQLNEVDQVDEIDLIMNPMVIFKYPIGHREVVDTERASLVSELVAAVATDETIAKAVSLDFARKFQERQGRQVFAKQGLTRDLYITSVQPRLVELAFALLKMRDPRFEKLLQPGYDSQNFLTHFLCKSTPFDEKIQTLCLPKEEKKIIEKLLADTPPQSDLERLIAQKLLFRKNMVQWLKNEIPEKAQRDLFGVAAKAIAEILPSSLLKECGSNYGIDIVGKKYVARPYEAAGSPKPTMFSNPYEQVIYTTQMSLYYGLPIEATEKVLRDLQKDAKIEMHKNACPLQETEGYRRFAEILGEDAQNFSFLETPLPQNLVKAFQEGMSKDPKWILYFMKGYVFQQISRYAHSASSTPQTLVGCSKHASGYSGTPQEGILPRGMTLCSDVGTDGKTINAVESKKPKVHVVKVEVGKKLVDVPFEMMLLDKDLYVYTDSAGWLKDENIEEFTEKLLINCEQSAERKATKGIIYHNAQGAIISCERDAAGTIVRVPLAQSAYKPQKGEMNTIIQQKYETGTNIPQKPTAKDCLSVRKGMTLRDALQSIFRMRQILLGQSVEFLISEDVKNDIASGILEGLLQNDKFRQTLSQNSTFHPDLVDTLHLEPEIAGPLKAAFQELSQNQAFIDRYRSGQVNSREFILEFLKCFGNHFEVDSKSLWRYFAANQAASDQEKNWLAGCQRMREVIERPIRMALTNTKISQEERLKLFGLIENLVILTEEDEPFESIASASLGVTAHAAIEHEVTRFMQIWSSIYAEEPGYLKSCTVCVLDENVRREIEANAISLYGTLKLDDVLRDCIDEKSIAGVIYISETVEGQELEQEAEEEKEEEIERELEIETQLGTPEAKSYIPLVSFFHDQPAYHAEQFFTAELTPIQKILPADVFLPHQDQLFCSANLFIDFAQAGSKEHATYHLPGRYLLAIDEPGKRRRYLLVSHNDAAYIKEGLIRGAISPPRALALFSFDGKIVAASSSDAKNIAQDDLSKQIIAEAKLVTARSNFSKKETELLATTLGDAKNKRAVRALYERIIKYKPAAAKRYLGSLLERMLGSAAAA